MDEVVGPPPPPLPLLLLPLLPLLALGMPWKPSSCARAGDEGTVFRLRAMLVMLLLWAAPREVRMGRGTAAASTLPPPTPMPAKLPCEDFDVWLPVML